MAKTTSKVLLAGFAGLAAGLAIGLLFAPAKGSKTRKKLRKRLVNLAQVIEDDVTGKLGALKSVFSGEKDEEEEEDEDNVQTAGDPAKKDRLDA
jgi:gas vesicle protein